nr:hypothetical protein MACL_00001138 [Theileria orientalis]
MDERRHISRLKAINLTKLQESYKKYTKVVPKETRVKKLSDSWHPNTPDYRINLSNSLWNKKLSNWRKNVHKWSYINESEVEPLSNKLKQGKIEEFVSICEGNKPDSAKFDVCDHLLNSHNSELFYPVIYKPSWFNGEISENNFQTLGEAEFISKSELMLSNLDKDFTNKFMSLYTSNYKAS